MILTYLASLRVSGTGRPFLLSGDCDESQTAGTGNLSILGYGLVFGEGPVLGAQ